MSVELGFSEGLLVFCAIVMCFRFVRNLPRLSSWIGSGFVSLKRRFFNSEHGDFYCFFHSSVLTGR